MKDAVLNVCILVAAISLVACLAWLVVSNHEEDKTFAACEIAGGVLVKSVGPRSTGRPVCVQPINLDVKALK